MRRFRFSRVFLTVAAMLGLLSAAWGSTFKVIYNFTGSQDGAFPVDAGNLAIDANGNLYGTTEFGGDCGQGTLFQLSPNGSGGWTETVMHSFCGSDGYGPIGGLEILLPLTRGTYVRGTTPYGGPLGTGVLFEAGLGGLFVTFTGPDFSCSPDTGVEDAPATGCLPYAGGGGWDLDAIPAYLGGTNGAGAVSDDYYGVYEFCSLAACADGANPASQVVADSQKTGYGTTRFGGVNNLGVVYALRCCASSSYSVLHSFAGGPNDGANPFLAILTVANALCTQFGCNQDLWGTTPSGGAFGSANGSRGYGTVFNMSLDGSNYGVVHNFGYIDGAFPYAGLTNLNGTFYGTTSAGGPFQRECCPLRFRGGRGTVYSLTPSGTLTTLHVFSGPDGASPYSGLVADSSGNLYGVTFEGGAYGHGVVYEITP